MGRSLVKEAAKAFTQGRYAEAQNLYRQLATQLGEKNFRANLALCQRRMGGKFRPHPTELPLRDLRVAAVMDEFTFHSYNPECQLLQLHPEHCLAQLEEFQPHFLFIESAWRGKDELWNRKISTFSQELKSIVHWCKQHQIPTAFWNKEDPVHFSTFLTTAQQFDFVFSTDIDCIPRYKAVLGHDNVYLLPFACQPKLHNPIELYQRKDAFCFAGAYYVRYPERTRDLEAYVAELPKYKPLEIFDRNYGKNDINYQFPQEFQPYIVGTLPFNEIDKAYKGYRYSINLNSIKQSQTMFARRVYELLGSNSITVSNYSRGVRLMFGDLVITSDSGSEIVSRLRCFDRESEDKYRLAGLRKVMLQHTYGHRLAYMANKVLGQRQSNELPLVTVVALVTSQEEYKCILEDYNAQCYTNKRLLVVLKPGKTNKFLVSADPDVTVMSEEDAGRSFLGNFIKQGGWLSLMVAQDYHGPNYLLDLALASRYSDMQIIGKTERYQWISGNVNLISPGQAYRFAAVLSMRASIAHLDVLPLGQSLLSWVERAADTSWKLPGLAIDPFNYCLFGRQAEDIDNIKQCVNDLVLDSGLPMGDLLQIAERIDPAKYDEAPVAKWSANKLNQLFGALKHADVHSEIYLGSLQIQSQLPDGKHEYVYIRDVLPINELPTRSKLETYLDVTPGLDIQYVFVFYDKNKKRLKHSICAANCNKTSEIPAGADYFRLGWRISGNGKAGIQYLQWGHRMQEPDHIFGRARTLLLTNHYPSYDDLYRNGFVHSRVKAYREHGEQVDIFRLRPHQAISYHEFQNIDVVTGSQSALEKLLDSGQYRSVLVHFLSPEMWTVLKNYPNLKKIIWVHGAEIQPWYRRDYNYQNEYERTQAQRVSEKRMTFWRRLLSPMPDNLKLVFVSHHFSEEVFEDLGFRVPEESYTIIHNPIDTKLFYYQEKNVEQRKKILSIRPYASKKYANDLSVQAILKLSEKPFFKELEFRMIGDGVLFEETLAPLRKFNNVTIERRFFSQAEISALHKEYGIFLVPSRMDSQGVSRDEAMASGLVPITSAVAAIPEFVDKTCGILAKPEDVEDLAKGIAALYADQDQFVKLSKAAAARVWKQSMSSIIVSKEVSLFKFKI